MNVEKYLGRIGYRNTPVTNLETLISLHKHHVLSIPFENLDVHQGKPITLEVDSLYKKVIFKNRGGFCYELNYLFYNLLHEIGFDGKIISSKIYDKDGKPGPAFDHMSIIVKLEEEWLLDVGYGDLFIEPIKIEDKRVKKDWFKFYRIDKLDEGKYLLSESKTGQAYKKRYEFDSRPRQIEEFYKQCEYKQSSEASHFVQNRICTLPSIQGRVTLLNDKLIKRTDGLREENEVGTELMFRRVLKEKFNIEL